MFIGLGVNILGGQKFRSQADRLREIGGLIYCKDYQNAGDVLADYAAGSPIGVFTSARSATAPATYVDDKGVIQLVTTADKPRFKGGYYDETGFHAQRGLMVEPSSTNLLTRTDGTAYSGGLWTGWTAAGGGVRVTSNKLIPELTSISGATSQRVVYVSGSDIGLEGPLSGVGSVANGDVITVSLKLKINALSGCSFRPSLQIYDSGSVYLSTYYGPNFTTVTSGWIEHQFKSTITNATASRIKFKCYIQGLADGDVADVEIYAVQAEKRHDATSYIPTSTSALTRPAEVLKYATAGNRNASEETILIKFAPNSTFANDGVVRQLLASDTKSRALIKNTTDDTIRTYPNISDNGSATRLHLAGLMGNTSYVVAGVVKHSSPYVTAYTNGSSNGSYTAGDWTDPAWGTYFYIGSNQSGANQLSGIIQSVAIFGRGLSDAEEATATAIMNN